jgi:hypothetical protein
MRVGRLGGDLERKRPPGPSGNGELGPTCVPRLCQVAPASANVLRVGVPGTETCHAPRSRGLPPTPRVPRMHTKQQVVRDRRDDLDEPKYLAPMPWRKAATLARLVRPETERWVV